MFSILLIHFISFPLISEECLKKCSKGEYSKVCGTDGKEYNKCTIKCHDFEGVSEECDRPCPCDKGNFNKQHI